VSSARDPILLLEPSNLLEPLNLQDRSIDLLNPSVRPDGDGTSRKWPRPPMLGVERGQGVFTFGLLHLNKRTSTGVAARSG
jgi:hypothetical protein